MSKSVEYYINDSDLESIAKTQTGMTKGTCIILKSKSVTNGSGFNYFISITLSVATQANFTIVGTQNNTACIDTISSSTDSVTSFSKITFDSISSITCDTDLSNLTISAGTTFTTETANSYIYSVPVNITGGGGSNLNLIKIYNNTFSVIETAANLSSGYNCLYDLYASLLNIPAISKTIPEMIGNELLKIGSFTADKPIINLQYAYQFCVLRVNSQSPYTFPGTRFRAFPIN